LHLFNQVFKIQKGKTTQKPIDTAAAKPEAGRDYGKEVIRGIRPASCVTACSKIASLLALEITGVDTHFLVQPVVNPLGMGGLAECDTDCKDYEAEEEFYNQALSCHGHLVSVA
jgi:hypothetical protein